MALSHNKSRGKAFRAMQVQEKRADAANERIAELRRELTLARREAVSERDIAERSQAALVLAHEKTSHLEECWRLEAHLRRELEERPLWRIAARRLRAFLGRSCR